VLSVGNIAVGGRAKTPLAGYIAARLRDMGERPAILSRGYGRRDTADGVVVVRDPGGIRADLDRSGDEPLMLARQLDGVAVLVCPDRHLAGRLAESHFGCTVHVLDDGFQHFAVHRDADIVVVAEEDLPPEGGSHLGGSHLGGRHLEQSQGAGRYPQTLPTGRLREPLDALAAAHAVLRLGDEESGDRQAPSGERRADGGQRTWRVHRVLQPVRAADPFDPAPSPDTGPVLALAGIAGPDRFVSNLRAAGWTIARELRFRDHHRYSRADVDAIAAAAREAGAAAVLTTEKDLVRLLPFRPFPVRFAFAPLALRIDGADTFDAWLKERVAAPHLRA
jgi:tetraacyldisaccharide 4'-kinase